MIIPAKEGRETFGPANRSLGSTRPSDKVREVLSFTAPLCSESVGCVSGGPRREAGVSGQWAQALVVQVR